MSPKECGETIRGIQRTIENLEHDIEKIAKAHIEDYHFLRHKVSTFWSCNKSPIGMCVWDLDDNYWYNNQNLKYAHCLYCGDPVERK